MRTRRLLLRARVVLAAALLVLGALEYHAYYQKLARGRLIDKEHCDRIKVGMSQAEVEDILGGPPGDFTTKLMFFIRTGEFDEGLRCERWTGNEGCVEVQFGEDGKVERKSFLWGIEAGQFYLDRVRALLRRFWP
jgi:hypothetical protein